MPVHWTHEAGDATAEIDLTEAGTPQESRTTLETLVDAAPILIRRQGEKIGHDSTSNAKTSEPTDHAGQ